LDGARDRGSAHRGETARQLRTLPRGECAHRRGDSRQRRHLPSSGPPWTAMPSLDLACARLGKWGRGKKARKGRQAVAARRAALLLAVAGWHAGTGAPPPPPCMREMWGGGQNRMELGFPGAAGGRGFVHARRAVSRRIIICGDGRLLASSESWAGFWPRRTQCVGRFGGPAIGCWTTGPGGRKGGGHGPH
jgi:hypothetical protein